MGRMNQYISHFYYILKSFRFAPYRKAIRILSSTGTKKDGYNIKFKLKY